MIATNPFVAGVEAPPIAEARGWLDGKSAAELARVIDLSQAVPGYPPAASLVEHLSRHVRAAETRLYTDILGRDDLRRALADHLAAFYGGEVAAGQVAITAGCNQAFYLVALALAGAGDRIVLPSPYYFNHRMTLDMLGIEAALLPCRASDGLVPDPEAAARLIDARTRAIVLITPNNPTGAIYPPSTIAAFRDLARRRGIALVIDETYKDFLPEGTERPHDLFADPDWDEVLIHLYSFSKAYSLPGYRIGAIAAAPTVLVEVEKIMDCVSICAPHIGQVAARFALGHLDAWRAEKRALMNARTAAFRAALAATNRAFEIAGLGAYFAYVRHPFADRTARDVARGLARDFELLCLPGSMFGPEQDAYLRFAFANVDQALAPEIVRRLAESTPD